MEARDIIKQKPYLLWYTKNYDGLSEEVIVEAVLNGGDWDDVQKLITLLGLERVAEIFRRETDRVRYNYSPKVVHYFNLYFTKYAQGYSH